MKAILEFDLNDADDAIMHKCVINADSMRIALWEIDQELRKHLKYNDNLTQEQYDILQQIRDFFWDRINHHQINID